MMKVEDDLIERGVVKLGDCDKSLDSWSKNADSKNKLFQIGDEEETSLRMAKRVVRRCNELLKFNVDRQEAK